MMKTSKLFALGLMGATLAFASSCTDDETDNPLGPSLSVTESTYASTGGDLTIEQGQSLTFNWDARKGDSDLDVFAISQTGVNVTQPAPASSSGNVFPYTISNANDETYVDSITFSGAGLNVGLTTYTFSVTDKDGATSSKTFDVMVEAPITDTPLSTPQPFTWTRTGGNPGTGLAQFGLKWTSNSGTSAIVKVENSNTLLVQLDDSDWTDITTEEELAVAISGATSIEQYTGVSAQQNGTYNDVLGVRYDGVDYILQVQGGVVTNVGAGTMITITGQYKD